MKIKSCPSLSEALHQLPNKFKTKLKWLVRPMGPTSTDLPASVPPSPHTFRAPPSVPPLKRLHARPVLADPSFWTGLVLVCLRLSWF